MTTALLFVAGVWLGTNIDLKELNNKNRTKEGINRLIAVVNQDLGISDGNINVKYSDAFVSSLNDGYKVVSYKEAQKGMENGDYAAIVTFPSDMSSNVYSLNSDLLKQSEIDFVVNPSLSENAYLETYLKVMDLQQDISKTISFLYISSLYDEFHNAQDKVKNVFHNDEDDMTALNDVELHDFRLRVNWSDIPQVDFNPTEIDFDEFVATVQGYADSMSKEYTDSYAVAQADYDVFQTGFSDSADKISSEGLSWYNQVDQREGKVSEQVSSLEKYRESLMGWSDKALLWNEANLNWRDNLSTHYIDLSTWKSKVLDWKTKSDQWGEAYQNDLGNYKISIDNYKEEVDTYLKKALDHYSSTTFDWAKKYTGYADNVETFLKTLVGEYNNKIGIDSDYIKSTKQYAEDLSTYKTNLNAVKDENFDPIINYYNQLKTFYLGNKQDNEQSNGQGNGQDNEQTNGLKQKNSGFYNSLLEFKQSLDNYKTKLEAYVGHSIDNEIGYDLSSKIETQKKEIDTYIENNKVEIEEFELLLNNISNVTIKEPPTSPDYSLLNSKGNLPEIDINDLQSNISKDELEEWNGEYSGDVPDANNFVKLDISKSKEKEVDPVENFEEDVPQFEGEEFEELNITEPEKLNDQLPEVPQVLLDNCNSIISESKKYIPNNYLNDDTKSKVNEIVKRYADNLTGVDSRLKANMLSNNGLLTQAYHGYNSYVYTLRSDADSAYNAQTDDLDKTLDSFYSVKKSTSKDNRNLLNDFSEKLPESRINSVTNKDYVNFTIAPLNFSTGKIRAEDQTQVSDQQKRLNILSVSIVSLLVMVIISLLFIVYFYIRERKKEKEIN